MNNCEDCIYSVHVNQLSAPRSTDASQDNYECRINPPVVVPHKDHVRTFWPTVKDREWCGQWSPEVPHA